MRGKTTFGIDLGSKLAGTTVVVAGRLGSSDALTFHASAKKQDADAMICSLLDQYAPTAVFVDAPLSLPGVYRQLTGFDDFHFRRGDRELAAMSPMFLGGLTARAMRLAAYHPGCHWFETYPAAQAKRLALPKDQYKKGAAGRPRLTTQLAKLINNPFVASQVTTWHHFDALLAWLAAQRHHQNQSHAHGDEGEGIIYV